MQHNSFLGIVPVLLASCVTEPTAPSAPPALPSGYSTVAAVGSTAPAAPAAEHRASGRPEIRYYEIADA